MADTLSEALLVSTSWNTASNNLTSQPTKTLVEDFCENTLKSDEVSELYCTVLDVEVSEDQKKDAESVGVTLIPATRSKWSDPEEDPAGVNWLVNHGTYYPGLKQLQHIKHVVSFSPKTKNAAAAIHESLFPQSKLHQLSPPEPNGVLFTFDIWNKDACGLTNYHRTIIHDFCVRKAKAGERLIAYSTVIDVELCEDQKTDAKKCGVTLIPAKRKTRGTMKKDLPNVDWLLKHEIYYPELRKLQNIKYVVGYAPKTGWAAVDIRETLFPDAKLVLINHACPEKNCLMENDDAAEPELEEDMLNMASEADMLFSIGTKIFEYFNNAYRANVEERQLSDIPHEEILPKPGKVYFDTDSKLVNGTNTGAPIILTYGQLDTQEALKTCESIAASIGSVANKRKALHKVCPDWKIKGISKRNKKKTRNFLIEKLNSAHVMPELYPNYSVKKLLKVLQQSHLCLPPSCYTDYSFEGLEAMAAGLPTRVQDDSHIASMIKKHFPMHTDVCVMTCKETCMFKKISRCLTFKTEAFDHAKSLKEDFVQSEVVTKSLAKFASVFEEEKGTKKSGKQKRNGKEKEKETEQSEDTHRGMPETKGIKTKETTTVHHGITADKDTTEDSETIDTAAVHHGMSVTEDAETTNATAVHHGMSVTEDAETTETTAVHHGMSVTEDAETTDTTAVHHGMSVTEDMETTDTTAVHHGMSVTDTETGEDTAMQPGSSNTGGVDTTDTITKQSLLVSDKETTSKNSKQSETFLRKESSSKEQRQTKQGHHRKRKKMNESDKQRKPKMPRKEIRSWQRKQSNPGRTERNESGPMKTNHTKYKTQRMKEMSTNPSNPPPLDSTKAKENADSDVFMVHVGLDEESYQQKMRDLDSQVQTRSVREKKEQLKAAWEKIKAEMDKTESEAITDNNSVQRVDQNCKDSFGEVTVTSMKQKCLAISLDLPTLYNLYRLKQTCLSGSFPDSFEPLLITDKMREEADKVGLQLKLKATYDQARFDELELFFINRDGGGLEPVKMYHDVIEGEDDEEILIDDEDTGQKSDTMVTGRIDGSSQTEQGQSTEDIQSKSEMERGTLESQLKEAKEEKGTLEDRCKELTQKLESTEQSLVSQRIGNSMEREKLQSELKQFHKLIKELQDKVVELEHQLEQSDLKKQGKKGDWSVTLVNGQHQDQGLKFKSPRGLAFHRDKLVMCDTGNNIVQILNKDYTCDKVLGSFDGQFAKPFRPLSVAISRSNHYFILDDENKQIVVCDENGKIIKIITLPENTEEVYDIALMDDFVLVTLRLTSPDTSEIPEDRGYRLVMYTQGGKHLKEVHIQIIGQGQFSWPVSVVVNSNNVIMVYDRGSRCIKCFDSDLNFLHQFGHSQLSGWILGYTGYIAVDEDDNVYVCDYFDRILKYRCDGKWICELLEGNVSRPWYIAVMGDKIGVVEFGSDQIKVFSK